ncbi:MAG: response regulator transcription factor [Chloroflexi bacterium]|nr:response regulator transcription factor [Chloroflexota bacterium]
MNRRIRILIADDHAVVREGLTAILDAQDDIELVGVAMDGKEAVDQAASTHPDVILLDLVMPRLDGLAAIERISRDSPESCILVLTSFADDERVFPAIKAGALGYYLKDTLPVELLQAIRDVAEGKVSLHPTIAHRVIQELSQSSDKPATKSPLTERELETLSLIARGMANQEIAEELSIQENSVAKYVTSILSKLHLANRTQAALYALRKGIASLE